KADAAIAFSKGSFMSQNLSAGHFSTVDATTVTNSINLTVTGHQGIQQNPGRIPVIEASYVADGQPVDIFDGNIVAINTLTSNDEVKYLSENRSIGLNLGREFDFAIPTAIKVGGYIEENARDGRTGEKTYTF